MTEVGIRALKQNASAVVTSVAATGPVTITEHGRPVAILGPLPLSRLAALVAGGRVRRAKTREPFDDPVSLPGTEGVPLSRTLAQMRADERY